MLCKHLYFSFINPYTVSRDDTLIKEPKVMEMFNAEIAEVIEDDKKP